MASLVLSRPEDHRQPYIISAVGEETLLARKKLKAYACAGMAFLLFSGLVVMYSIRVPIPI